MKESIRTLQGLPSVQNGFEARHINENRAKFTPMSRWHMSRKPYTSGGCPTNERR